MSTDVTAEGIVDDLLYRTGKPFANDDFSDISNCFMLPQYMETVTGSSLIETEEALHQVFFNVIEYYKENGVVDIARTVVSAEFLRPDVIGSTHVSRLMRAKGELFRAPFPVYSIIRLIGVEWRIVSTTYAILDAPDHNKALLPETPAKPPMK